MVDSQKRIAGAFLIGGAIVATAFLIRMQQTSIPVAGTIAAVGTTDRAHIAVEDADKNGIPDWQDVLLTTEPVVVETSATTTYEAPDTITGKFALRFFEDAIRSKQYGAFGSTPDELIAEATQGLINSAADELFTEKDIEIVAETNETILRAYGNHIASIALSQKSGSESEITILQDAVRYDTKERLADLEPIAASYVNMVKLMLETPVPEAYVKQHLDLLNAYNAIRGDIKGMQKLHEDPLYTFIRVKRYEDDVLGLSNAVLNLFSALYLQDNITWSDKEPASQLVRFET